MTAGVVLYGPPAAGKDTVSTALHNADPRLVLFERLKVGDGRTTGYRLSTEDQVERLRAADQIIWENTRYGARYVIDQPTMAELVQADRIPVVHVGQPAAVNAIRAATPEMTWLAVYLWCPRSTALQRLRARGSTDIPSRLRAWDETPTLPGADLTLDTSTVEPAEAARRIVSRLRLRASH